MRKHVTWMLCAATAAVAASAATSPLEAQFARARVWPPGFTTQLALDTMTTPTELDAPYGKVFTATVAAFEEFRIAFDTRDSVRGMIGNLAIKKSGSFAGAQLSRWMNCGQGMTGPNADNFRIYIAIAALLDRVASTNRTQIRVAMVAGAQDMQGNAKDAVACGSSGALESKILESVKKRVSGP